MAVSTPAPVTPSNGEGLGTFLGVFTPSILTILGVILFLRTGWVVGSVGLFPALLIAILANAITLVTALSVSAVATNMPVGAGGAYYILSRSLGLEVGGAIGIPLFLAQTFSVTLYAFGLAESLRFAWPDVQVQGVAALIIVLVSAISARSAGIALKLQIPIMCLVGLALISLFLGVPGPIAFRAMLTEGVTGAPPFWTVFAVFFPAVTGIMAGISLSGDLKDPQRAIPRGTIAAVLAGFAVYLAVPIALAMAAGSSTLSSDPLVWLQIAVVPTLVLPGLWGAILSSAVGSILGAPRTLEALATDGVAPKAIASGSVLGVRRAHILSTIVALAPVALGGLDAVAPVLTMFFLTTYGMVNLVAGLERLARNPSFRPTLEIPWSISLTGAAACFWVMFLINHVAGFLALAAEILIYLVLRRRTLRASWGDLRYGALMSLARATLLQLRRLPVAPRNWRPHILLFAGDVQRRRDLVQFADWLNQGRGIVTVNRLLVGSIEDLAPGVRDELERIQSELDESGITAFAEVEVVRAFETGAVATAQANGIAGIASNTAMFGWSRKIERVAGMLRVMRQLSLLDKSTVILRVVPQGWSVRRRRIDVWWGGLEHNGDLMLLLAYLLSMNPEWRSSEIVVHSLANDPEMQENTRAALKRMLKLSRIPARTEVILRPPDRPVSDVINEISADADVVVLGLAEPVVGSELVYAERLAGLVSGLPTTLLVRHAGPFAGRLLDGSDTPHE